MMSRISAALNTRPGLRWIVPALAALAVLGSGAVIGAIARGANPSLAPRSAAELLVDLQTARVDGMSGTVVYTANLGLPALPGAAERGGADLATLLAGTHTLRVWYSGPNQARLALLGTLGETDIITNGHDLWTWSSRENKATHRVLPAEGTGPPDQAGSPDRAGSPTPDLTRLPLTPQQLADAALAALEPSTQVSTEAATRVAGREAYELILIPRDDASLVASVRIAIDASEHVPLRVQVLARAQAEPAIQVAFTQVSFARPDPEHFTFNPPPGATVAEVTAEGRKTQAPDPTAPGREPPQFTVVGTGWTRVLVVRVPQPSTTEPSTPDGDAPLGPLSTLLAGAPRASGTWGSGSVLTSALVTALLTDDGRLLIGAVRPEKLFQAAADPTAQLDRLSQPTPPTTR